MAVSTPFILLLSSASICLLNVLFFPQILPNIKLTTLFAIIASTSFTIWGFWKAFVYPSWYDPLRHLPLAGSNISRTVPLIGHPLVTFRQPSGDIHLKFITEVPNDGLIRFPGLFNQNWLLLADPSSLGEVLVHKSYDWEKPKDLRNFLRMILGDGLILVEGDEHKFQRKHLAPAFSFRHIKELYPIFWQKATDLVGRVTAEIHENPVLLRDDEKLVEGVVEVNHWANKVTMDIIGVAGLGREVNSLYTTDDELVQNYEEILEPTFEKAIYFGANILLSPTLVGWLPWKLNKALRNTTSTLRRICHEFVREKKAAIKNEKEQNVDILSGLIKSNNFGDDMLVDQLLTFLAAGHETTSSSFTWASYLLSKHPEIQARLRDEIRQNLPSPSAPLDPTLDLSATIEALPYLHGVCCEILRLYPPVPTTVRIAVRDTTINSQPIPAGTRIFLSMWGINRSPHLWGSDAASFVPERWIDTRTGKANNTGGQTNNYAHLTFLHGPRSCIGEKFARSELKSLMAVWVGRLGMKMADPEEVPVPAGAITTKPRDGMRLQLKILDGW